jgi:MtN3 and saliva related transmembrane protein
LVDGCNLALMVQGQSRAGTLLQNSKGLFLLLQGDQTTFAFAVQDGKVQEVSDPYVVIQEWKIVLRGLDEHEVIFEWPDKKP